MQNQDHRQHRWRPAVFFLIALAVIIADQTSKTWVQSVLEPGQAIWDVGFFRILHVINTGAAFGIFQGHTFILTIVSITGVAVLLACGVLAGRCFSFIDNVRGMTAMGLVLGGTVGNLIDRIRQGYVTDFLDFNYWPTFNIADSAVTIGALMLAYVLLSQLLAESR